VVGLQFKLIRAPVVTIWMSPVASVVGHCHPFPTNKAFDCQPYPGLLIYLILGLHDTATPSWLGTSLSLSVLSEMGRINPGQAQHRDLRPQHPWPQGALIQRATLCWARVPAPCQPLGPWLYREPAGAGSQPAGADSGFTFCCVMGWGWQRGPAGQLGWVQRPTNSCWPRAHHHPHPAACQDGARPSGHPFTTSLPTPHGENPEKARHWQRTP
jgi:hypothetical protein